MPSTRGRHLSKGMEYPLFLLPYPRSHSHGFQSENEAARYAPFKRQVISDTRLTNPSLHTQHKYPQAGLPPAVFDSPCSCTTHSLSLPCSVSLLATPVFVSTKTLFLPRPFTRISLINLALLPESGSSQRYVTMIPTSLFAIARFTHPFLPDPLIAVGNWEAGLCCTVVVAVLDTNCCE